MAFEQQDILDALFSIIQAAIPGVGVYHGVAPKDANDPYAVITLVSDLPAIYFSMSDDFRVYFQVDVYAVREFGTKELRAIGEKIKAVLHKKPITMANAAGASAFCTSRGVVRPENDSYNRVTQQYVILGSEV